ncbi:hypothetical protein ABID70_001564 [Clavibacter michiganensis]|uniref:hypothetical protein n=1 Tax=Clavibacter michiganensis TaxID=28447 RepID=UPI001AE8EF15|nr:hypothetical protein [Clavibacter michiganensis]MBP2458995.1 hypothetical protein [Clavibacter michiganensis]MDQ0411567.1 hypothetical protein [Clavibacter michiganensis]
MSTDVAPSDRTAVPLARLLLVLVVLGVAGVVTAGGTVLLVARIEGAVTGFEVDGLSLLLPGLAVTAVVTFLAAATTALVVRGARRIEADALARHVSVRAAGRCGSAPSGSRARRSSAPPARCPTWCRPRCRAARSCCAPPCCSARCGAWDPVS